MWERIGDSSAVIIGAVVLFLLFAAVLFIMERDEYSRRRSKHPRPYLVSRPGGNRNSINQLHTGSSSNTCHDVKIRKIS